MAASLVVIVLLAVAIWRDEHHPTRRLEREAARQWGTTVRHDAQSRLRALAFAFDAEAQHREQLERWRRGEWSLR